MTDQEILDNAPKNTSIVDSKFKFFDDVYCELDKKGEWNWKCSSMPKYPIRSLADIKRIAELEKERVTSDLKVEIKALELALAFISDPDLIYNKCKESKIKLKALKEQVNG